METPEGVGDPGGRKSVTPQKVTRPTTLLEDAGRTGSPGPTRLKNRVNFYEQVWSGANSPSTETVPETETSNVDDSSLFVDVSDIERRLQEQQLRRRAESPVKKEHVKLRSTRAGDGGSYLKSASTEDSSSNSESFEETFERSVEEGDLLGGGAKIVKFERITIHKSVKEITAVRPNTPGSGATPSDATMSRTPSEERVLQDDSAYHTVSHSQPSANGYHTSVSKSSSVTSLAGRFPSEESLRRTPSREGLQQAGTAELEGGSRPGSTSSIEWYSEYRTQSFHNMAAKLEYVRSRSQYDSHIAEIKGTCHFHYFTETTLAYHTLLQANTHKHFFYRENNHVNTNK
jgi:nesprin-1